MVEIFEKLDATLTHLWKEISYCEFSSQSARLHCYGFIDL